MMRGLVVGFGTGARVDGAVAAEKVVHGCPWCRRAAGIQRAGDAEAARLSANLALHHVAR